MPESRLSFPPSPGAAQPVAPSYSNSVRVSAGNLLFVAGQVAVDEQGQIVGRGDPAAQCEQVMKNIQAICRGAGASMADIVKMTVFVTDMRLLAAMAPVRARYMGQHRPASTAVQVVGLFAPEILLEIEAVVAVP